MLRISARRACSCSAAGRIRAVAFPCDKTTAGPGARCGSGQVPQSPGRQGHPHYSCGAWPHHRGEVWDARLLLPRRAGWCFALRPSQRIQRLESDPRAFPTPKATWRPENPRQLSPCPPALQQDRLFDIDWAITCERSRENQKSARVGRRELMPWLVDRDETGTCRAESGGRPSFARPMSSYAVSRLATGSITLAYAQGRSLAVTSRRDCRARRTVRRAVAEVRRAARAPSTSVQSIASDRAPTVNSPRGSFEASAPARLSGRLQGCEAHESSRRGRRA